MSESENKASVQHTPAEWISSNQDHYINADKAKYNSEKVLPIFTVNHPTTLFLIESNNTFYVTKYKWEKG